jgi:hypothetical protein
MEIKRADIEKWSSREKIDDAVSSAATTRRAVSVRA